MWTESDWKVENGVEPSGFGGFAEFTFDLILLMAVSVNLKTFSFSGFGGGAVESPLADAGCGGGGDMSSFTRVLRALVRSRNGGTDMS